MKKLLCLLVVLCGAYTAYWYYQAYHCTSTFESALQAISQERSQPMQLQYDAVETSGFPFDIRVLWKNPKVTLGSGVLVLNGNMQNRFSVTGHLEEITFTGKAQAEVPDEEGKLQHMEIDGTLSTISETKSFHPVAFMTVRDFLQDFAKNIAQNNGTLVLKDLQVKIRQDDALKPLFSIDEGRLSCIHTPLADDRRRITVTNEIKGLEFGYMPTVEVSSQFEYFMNRFRDALVGKQSKTDGVVELEVELPSQETIQEVLQSPFMLLAKAVPACSLVVKKCAFSNSFGTSQVDGAVHVRETSKQDIEGDIAFTSSGTYSKQYYEAVMNALNEMARLEATATPTDEEGMEYKELLTHHLDELKALAPHFEEFGTFQCNGDFKVACNKRDFDTRIELGKFELLNALYGIVLSGKGHRVHGETSGKVTLEVKNYRHLVHDAVRFYNRALFLFHDPDMHPVSRNLLDQFINFLDDISNVPHTNSADVAITVRYKDDQDIQVGTLSWNDFQMRLAAFMMAVQNELRPEAAPKAAKEEPQAAPVQATLSFG